MPDDLTGTAGWDLGLTAGEQAELAPALPPDVDRAPDVLVVGGGVVGLAAALMCRTAGMSTVVLEQGPRLCAGPSGRAAGVMNPAMHLLLNSAEFAATARRGTDLLRDLDAQWGGEAQYREASLLLSGHEGDGLVFAGAARRLERDELGRLEPEAVLDGVVEVPSQGMLDPLRLGLALARRAGTVATSVTVDFGSLDGAVGTSAGEFQPRSVIVAAGMAGPVAPGLTPREVKGHLLMTAPVDFTLNHALYEEILVRQRRDGRLLAGSTFDTEDGTRPPQPARMAWIRAQLERIVPRATGVAVEAEWSCFRPAVQDFNPVVDRVPGTERAYLSVAHFRTGIMMAAVLGQDLAEWIVSGRRPAELEQFALDRRSLGAGFGALAPGYSRGEDGDHI